jgi:PAS domain S-box-containing protein
MQHLYKRFSVTIGFLLLLILLIANAMLTRRQLAVQVDDQAWVQHTQQVLLVASQTQAFIEDAETGQRGYLYTGDPRFLAPYDLAVTQLEPSIQQLAHLTVDNPSEQRRIATLHTLTQEKMSELAQTILLYQEGHPDDAKALFLSSPPLHIRNVIDTIIQEETSLRAARASAYRSSVERTIESIYFATLIAAFGLLILAYYILNEINLRDRHLNPIAEQLIGTQLVHAKGKPVEAVFPIFNESTHLPVDNPVKKVVELGAVIGLANHTVLQRTDGTFIPIEDSAAPIRDSYGKLVGVVLVFRDATSERQSQELLRKTEKLAAAARLAATVSHEINNPLEAVGNLIYIVKTTDGMPPDASALLSQAEQELDRVSHITRQTLGFYRESKLPDEVNLADIVETVLRIYSNKFRTKDIVVERDIQVCPPIHGLAGELNQAIGNLISNAADAVPQGGTIRVEMACINNADAKAVQISIQDNGSGISPENKEHIFEPFFTTKKDVGTGLGLWVTKEIVERHGGTIQVHPGTHPLVPGTVFNVLLPIDHKLHSPSPQA